MIRMERRTPLHIIDYLFMLMIELSGAERAARQVAMGKNIREKRTPGGCSFPITNS
jgi:hypothetical protein